jgi:hypothetical protein
MHEAREELLAGARLALDQHGDLAARHLRRDVQRAAQGRGAAHDARRLFERPAVLERIREAAQLQILLGALFLERLGRALERVLPGARLAVEAPVLEGEADHVGQGLHQLSVLLVEAPRSRSGDRGRARR